MTNSLWIADDVNYEPEYLDSGSTHYESDDDVAPMVRQPIGFMRHKPIVRVKAWIMPRKPVIRVKARSMPIAD